MGWSKIKILLIVLLVAANLLFALLLLFNEANMSYIDNETIDNTVNILAKSNIILDRSLLTGRKVKLSLEYGKFSDAYYEEVLLSVTGSDSYITRMTMTGISLISNENEDRFDFYDNFRFQYFKFSSAAEELSLRKQEYFSAGAGLTDKKIVKSLTEKAETFLLCRKSEEMGFTLGNVAVFEDTSNGFYYLYGSQYCNGAYVNGNDIYCVFNENELIYAEGTWVFKNLGQSYSVDHIDIVNLLFIDKKYISENQESLGEVNIIAEIIMEYGIFWNGAKTEFYLVPMWKIKYTNGEQRIYNAINGNIYIK